VSLQRIIAGGCRNRRR